MSDVTGGVDDDLATAVIERRLSSGEAEVRSAGQVSDTAFLEAVPWRTFRFYQGQRHYSGKYWAATERDHVIYESRLELCSLLLADFDPAVNRVAAQPFRLSAVVNGRLRRRMPDYLWGSGFGLTVVDVVRAQRLAENPKIQMLCDWTREVLEALGWKYRVLSEQPPSCSGTSVFLPAIAGTSMWISDLSTAFVVRWTVWAGCVWTMLSVESLPQVRLCGCAMPSCICCGNRRLS